MTGVGSPEGQLSSAERRTQVLEAAARVISAKGVRAFRLVDVADEAGVSVGLVQHYFRTRATLLLETFRSAYDRAADSLAELSSSEPDPLRRLTILVHYSMDADRWPIWLEYWGAAFRDPRIRERCESEYRRWAAHFHDVIREGTSLGIFRPTASVEDVADRLLVLINGLAVRLLLQDQHFQHDRAHRLAASALATELGLTDEQRSGLAALPSPWPDRRPAGAVVAAGTSPTLDSGSTNRSTSA